MTAYGVRAGDRPRGGADQAGGAGSATGVGELWALLAIAHRDLLKLWRDRARLAVNLAFPVLLVLGLGSVLRYSIGPVHGLDPVTVAFTGVLAATLFQSTAAGMISLVEDRETDFARELFVAPVRRSTLIAGKVLGEAAVAAAQGVAVTVFAVASGVPLGVGQVVRMLPVALACCLLGGAFGLTTVAALPNQRAAMQIFQFLIIPQYLLGGVLVPLHGLPGYLDAIAAVLPLRYAVDLNRAAYYGGAAARHGVADLPTGVAAAVVVGLVVLLGAAGGWMFAYRERNR
jgi:ABC-2 type transport system permease protein